MNIKKKLPNIRQLVQYLKGPSPLVDEIVCF